MANNTNITFVDYVTPVPAVWLNNVNSQVNGTYSVTNYGADPTGVQDSTGAFQQAINAAISNPNSPARVYIPAGKYLFPATSPSLDVGTGNIEFVGDGRRASILLFNEGTNAAPKNLFVSAATVSGATLGGDLAFRNLGITGTFFTNGNVNQGGSAFFLNYFNSIYINDCRFYGMANMVTQCEAIKEVFYTNNECDSNVRDNCRFRSSFNCIVMGNRFLHSDDDAVALHQANYIQGSGNIREALIVANNTFEDTCGIHILGGRNTIVANNILRRVKQTIIEIDSDVLEGANPMWAIRIHNNQIFDSIIRPISFPTDQFTCIGVNYGGVYGNPFGTGVTVPGENTTGTTSFILPNVDRDSQATGTSFPAMYGIFIHDNLIMNTLPPVSAYSNWGFGQCFTSTGFVNPAVTAAELRPTCGIALQSDTRNWSIHNNTVMGCNYGVCLDAPTRNFSSYSARIQNNLFYDCILGGITVISPASLENMQVWIDGNEFNLDPYYLSTNRSSSGSWNADTGPYGISANGISGFMVTNNLFQNTENPMVGSNSGNWNAKDNWVRCQPVSVGFNSGNKGVGNVPVAGSRFLIDTFYSDPTQSNYLTPMNTSGYINEASSMPTSGYWAEGTFVRNVNMGLNVFGWLRLTTGSNNVNEADWKTVTLS